MAADVASPAATASITRRESSRLDTLRRVDERRWCASPVATPSTARFSIVTPVACTMSMTVPAWPPCSTVATPGRGSAPSARRGDRAARRADRCRRRGRPCRRACGRGRSPAGWSPCRRCAPRGARRRCSRSSRRRLQGARACGSRPAVRERDHRELRVVVVDAARRRGSSTSTVASALRAANTQ